VVAGVVQSVRLLTHGAGFDSQVYHHHHFYFMIHIYIYIYMYIYIYNSDMSNILHQAPLEVDFPIPLGTNLSTFSVKIAASQARELPFFHRLRRRRWRCCTDR